MRAFCGIKMSFNISEIIHSYKFGRTSVDVLYKAIKDGNYPSKNPPPTPPVLEEQLRKFAKSVIKEEPESLLEHSIQNLMIGLNLLACFTGAATKPYKYASIIPTIFREE